MLLILGLSVLDRLSCRECSEQLGGVIGRTEKICVLVRSAEKRVSASGILTAVAFHKISEQGFVFS
jgi:hypothetical protein